ncbi:hypothetical protein [Bacteroides sp.]|nr:hypothetical protein [Bacteroides sp.]MDE5761038.1 hypothetical protein [Bacteroides sp.]MDE6214904.1 hypothetical protein [Bacteroides sp.]MDE6492246.1 hypothetical protein [Lactobacillus sp.]
MKKEEKNKCILLNEAEVRNVNGGYREPTPEELERIREIYGPLAEYIICW